MPTLIEVYVEHSEQTVAFCGACFEKREAGRNSCNRSHRRKKITLPGRRRLKYLNWLEKATGMKPRELIKSFKIRRYKDIMTAAYAGPWHGTLID
jgi:hypothetical protein